MGLMFDHPITNEEMMIQINEPAKFESLMAREKKRFDKYHSKSE
jgi:hypothetical protein